MIDPDDALGITDEPTTIPIERGKIREFAHACFISTFVADHLRHHAGQLGT